MGNSQEKQKSRQFAHISCQDDDMCKNIDAKRSTVDKLVYVCPKAVCNEGTCSCGPNCEKDPYTNMCCSEVEKKVINGQLNTFCIESPYDEDTFCNLK